MNPGYNPQDQNSNNQAPIRDPWGNAAMPRSVADASAETRADFIRKTYFFFMAGVLSCVAMGAMTLASRELWNASISILQRPILAFGLIVGGSILAQTLARKEGLNYVALFGFTGLMGFLFAPIVDLYAPAVVGQSAALSVLIFGALTAYALISKKDFSFMGGMLFIGFIALIGGSLLNALFFKNWGLDYWISWGVLLFSGGFVLYQTSNILHEYQENQYCAAALGLFISFLNIFMSLLRILGGGRN